MLLKNSTKKRRPKEEIAEQKREDEEEKMMISELKEIKPILHSKGVKLDSIPNLLDQNAELVHYLQSKGSFDQNGKLIP